MSCCSQCIKCRPIGLFDVLAAVYADFVALSCCSLGVAHVEVYGANVATVYATVSSLTSEIPIDFISLMRRSFAI